MMENLTAKQPSIAFDLLNRFLGKRVVELTRFSWWPASDVALECGIRDELAFSLTAGPLSITFDADNVIGVASNPSMNSVIVWDEGHRSPGSLLKADVELFAISASEERYATSFWRRLIGAQLSGISILKRKQMSVKEKELPSELGLCFKFTSGECFVASHGLHDGSDDFSVLEESQMMPMEVDEIKLGQLN